MYLHKLRGGVTATYVADASHAPRQKEENIGGVKLGRVNRWSARWSVKCGVMQGV